MPHTCCSPLYTVPDLSPVGLLSPLVSLVLSVLFLLCQFSYDQCVYVLFRFTQTWSPACFSAPEPHRWQPLITCNNLWLQSKPSRKLECWWNTKSISGLVGCWMLVECFGSHTISIGVAQQLILSSPFIHVAAASVFLFFHTLSTLC